MTGGYDAVGEALDGAVEVTPPPRDSTADMDAPIRPPRRPPGSIRKLPDGCPVVPLGTHGNTYYFLDSKRQVAAIEAEKMGRLRLLSLFDRHMEMVYRWWPKLDKDGAVTNWKTEAVQEDLMAAAGKLPIFNPMKRLRGLGAWCGEKGELILHCGDRLWRGRPPADPDAFGEFDQFLKPGEIDGMVYAADERMPVPAETPQPPGDDGPAGELLTLLRTWSWRRGETDAVLLLGWIGAAMLGAAIEWRPMVWLTGDRGSGKSTVHKVLKLVLGDAVLSVTDATAAGVWQAMGHSSLPVALDEIEADFDNRKAQAIIKLARDAASGGLTVRGGAEHKGAMFTIKACFLFSSILVPPLLPADRSRMAILDLDKLTQGVPPPVLNPVHWREVGAALRRRLVDGWDRWEGTLEAYRMALVDKGHDARGADQLGTLLAAADLLLNDHPPSSDELEGWGDKLPAAERDDDDSDHEQFIGHLVTSVPDSFRGSGRRQIGDVIAQARRDMATLVPDGNSEANQVLGTFGMRVVSDRELKTWGRKDGEHDDRKRLWLAIANKHGGLAELFDGTRWAGGTWKQAAGRCECKATDGLWARPLAWKQMRFGEVSQRCTLVPIEAVLPDPSTGSG